MWTILKTHFIENLIRCSFSRAKNKIFNEIGYLKSELNVQIKILNHFK